MDRMLVVHRVLRLLDEQDPLRSTAAQSQRAVAAQAAKRASAAAAAAAAGEAKQPAVAAGESKQAAAAAAAEERRGGGDGDFDAERDDEEDGDEEMGRAFLELAEDIAPAADGAAAAAATTPKLPSIDLTLAAALCGGQALADQPLQLKVTQHQHLLKLQLGQRTLQLKWEALDCFLAPAAAGDGKEAAPAPALEFDVCCPPKFKERKDGKMIDIADFSPSAVASAQTRYRLEFRSAAALNSVAAMLSTSKRLAALLAVRLPVDAAATPFDAGRFAANMLGDNPRLSSPLATDAAAVTKRLSDIEAAVRGDTLVRRCFRCGRDVKLSAPHLTCFEPLPADEAAEDDADDAADAAPRPLKKRRTKSPAADGAADASPQSVASAFPVPAVERKESKQPQPQGSSRKRKGRSVGS